MVKICNMRWKFHPEWRTPGFENSTKYLEVMGRYPDGKTKFALAVSNGEYAAISLSPVSLIDLCGCTECCEEKGYKAAEKVRRMEEKCFHYHVAWPDAPGCITMQPEEEWSVDAPLEQLTHNDRALLKAAESALKMFLGCPWGLKSEALIDEKMRSYRLRCQCMPAISCTEVMLYEVYKIKYDWERWKEADEDWEEENTDEENEEDD